MRITQNLENGLVNVKVEGRLDATSSIEAQKELERILDADSSKMLVDLSGLEYISSAGLRVLLVVAKKMQQKGGKIVLAALTPNVKEVFEAYAVDEEFRKIIDSKKFAELGVHPSGEAFKKLPVEFKNNIPSFINQNVNLKRLENVR